MSVTIYRLFGLKEIQIGYLINITTYFGFCNKNVLKLPLNIHVKYSIIKIFDFWLIVDRPGFIIPYVYNIKNHYTLTYTECYV